jgi:spore maturation protein CgeB
MMRLLFVYKQNPQDPSEKALRRWLPRLVDSFKEFSFRKQERRRFDPDNLTFSPRLKALLEDYKPTHLFCWLLYLNPEEMEWCKLRGIKLIAGLNGFATFSTGLYRNQSLYFDSLRQLDAFLVPHRPHIPALLKQGIKAFEMPFFYDPEVFRPFPAVWKRFVRNPSDIFFVGNFGDVAKEGGQGMYRKQAIKALGEISQVKVMSDHSDFLPNIKHVKPTGSDWLINWHANTSRACICFDYFPDINDYESMNENVVQHYDIDYKYAVRPRILTMMGAGTPVFIDRHPEIERIFEDGRDVVMWSDLDELRDRVNQYLASPSELQELASNGLCKVQDKHTVERRLLENILPTITN